MQYGLLHQISRKTSLLPTEEVCPFGTAHQNHVIFLSVAVQSLFSTYPELWEMNASFDTT